MKNFKKVEKLLNAFTFGEVQNFLNFLRVLDKNSLSTKDVEDFVISKRELMIRHAKLRVQKQRARRDLWNKVAKKCPKCGKMMSLDDAGSNDCHWFCKCGFGIYSANMLEEELIEIGFQEAH